VKATEKATRAVIRSISVDVDRDPLARVAIVLSQRIDADPADDILTRLSRELRLVMAALRDLAGEAGTNDIDAFLERIAAPELGPSAN
jgi:hypothetical protein